MRVNSQESSKNFSAIDQFMARKSQSKESLNSEPRIGGRNNAKQRNTEMIPLRKTPREKNMINYDSEFEMEMLDMS